MLVQDIKMKKKTPKELLEIRREKWRGIGVKVGAYLFILIGIIISQAFPNLTITSRVIDATYEPIQYGQIAGGMLFSFIMFWVIERGGDFEGKKKNLGRLFSKALMVGFMFNEVAAKINFGGM